MLRPVSNDKKPVGASIVTALGSSLMQLRVDAGPTLSRWAAAPDMIVTAVPAADRAM